MKSELRHALNVGREHYKAGELDRAEPFLLEVLKQHDGFADVHNMIGVIRHQRGQLEVATQSFERALAINPGYTEAALNLAVCYNELGRYDDATRVYRRASGEREDEGAAPLAFVRQREEHDEADGPARTPLPLCPPSSDIRTTLGTALRDSGRVDEAITELTALRDASPNYLPARLQLGVAYWSANRFDEARSEWEFVLSRDPGNRSAKVYLAMER